MDLGTRQTYRHDVEFEIPDGKEFGRADHEGLARVSWELARRFGVFVRHVITKKNGTNSITDIDARDTTDLGKHTDYVDGKLRLILKMPVHEDADGRFVRATYFSDDERDTNGMLSDILFDRSGLSRSECARTLEDAEFFISREIYKLFQEKMEKKGLRLAA